MKIKDKLNKLFWPIDNLTEWKKNPKAVNKKDYKRLKKQIKKFGQYKPLLVNSGEHVPTRGEVIGGNTRLKAYRELNISQCWVSVVDPKTEAEKIEYALSDNDEVGYYLEEELGELVYKYKDKIELPDYKVNLGKTVDLQKILDDLGPGGTTPKIKCKVIVNCEDEVEQHEVYNKIRKLGYNAIKR